MTAAQQRRMRTASEARELLTTRFPGLNLALYAERVVKVDDDGIILQVEFTHRTRATITVSNIWTDESGHIVQCGSNSGELVY